MKTPQFSKHTNDPVADFEFALVMPAAIVWQMFLATLDVLFGSAESTARSLGAFERITGAWVLICWTFVFGCLSLVMWPFAILEAVYRLLRA